MNSTVKPFKKENGSAEHSGTFLLFSIFLEFHFGQSWVRIKVNILKNIKERSVLPDTKKLTVWIAFRYAKQSTL